MTPSARILGTSKATAQPRRSDNPRPSDGRTGDAYNTPAFSARFGTSNTRLGLSGRAEFLLAHVKIFYTFQKRVKKLAIFLHVKSAAPDPAVKETLRYREALFAGFEEVRRHPLNTNIALKVSSHISGYNMELRSLPGTFIGNPTTLEARYTPPEGKELIARKLGDWEKIVHIGDELDPLVAMAVAHYQFEAIHPFTDSNGRTGRILNILMLIERRLLSEPVLYLSRYIIENKNEYYDRLLAVTRDGAWHEWLSFMLSAVQSTSEETLATIDRIQGLRRTIREQMRSNRGSSNADLLDLLLERPYCRIADVENACNVTRPTATKRLEELVAAGVLDDRRAGRDRLFVNVPLMEILRNPKAATSAR